MPGGRYHITARGNERKDLFWDDTDRFHFLALLAEATQRFGARVRAYGLMRNHYHLLLETPEANLSLAMQWLNGSYCVWFNRGQRRGNWGRDAALWLGRRGGRLRLAQLGQLAGGMDYATVSQAVARFSRRLGEDPEPRQELAAIEQQLFNDKI